MSCPDLGQHQGIRRMKQRAIRIECGQDKLVAVLAMPDRPGTRGVLVITGGPQYRVGSHRQFVLLARQLAQDGMPVMRFDQRGMGDSEGKPRKFDEIDHDISCAIAAFFAHQPQLTEIVLWGLCDGATAASFHAPSEPRVCGLILLNPWVRTEAGEARTTLRYYYVSRLRQWEFWRKLLRGKVQAVGSLQSIGSQLRHAGATQADSLPERMMQALGRFGKPILIVLSGQDLTAREFSDVLAGTGLRCDRADVPDANHTFSSRAWRDQLARTCSSWIASW
jgi:exosortase A-associated hydrolase 1